jgi:serine/threonine protein kinase
MMADWWSYGILVYELLCGKPPFHEGSTDRILDLISSSNVRFPSTMKISSVTRDFIIRLLKKLPKERIGQNEFHQISTHHFFQSANVNSILNQKTQAPLMPNISGDPLSNFEAIYTNQSVEDFNSSTDAGVLDQIGDLFEEFKN